ncbi:MAG: hypothetical protein R2881_10195 [Eubacteriales bacterium]
MTAIARCERASKNGGDSGYCGVKRSRFASIAPLLEHGFAYIGEPVRCVMDYASSAKRCSRYASWSPSTVRA